MDSVTPKNKLVDKVIKEAEDEIYEGIVKTAKGKLKGKLREQKKAIIILNNINREIEEIKLEIGHDIG